jgi:uncharacterized membrane protein
MENRGAVESLKKSYRLGKKHFSFSAVFWILIVIISSVGGITRIGLLVTVPFTILATAIAYKVISKKGKRK